MTQFQWMCVTVLVAIAAFIIILAATGNLN